MALEGAGSDVPDLDGRMVLFDEQATDGRLKDILQQVLREQVMSVSVKSPEWKETGIINRMFAAARGISPASWQRQREPWANDS